jgi:pentatricopeptide repeat protein
MNRGDLDKQLVLEELLGLLRSSRWQEARALLSQCKMRAPRGFYNKLFFHSLIDACAKANSPDGAAWAIRELVQAGTHPNVVTYNSLINGFAQVADVDGATKWFRHMQATGIDANYVTYSIMVNTHLRASDLEGAVMWMNRMGEAGIKPKVHVFSNLINAFGRIGNIAEAEWWFHEMVEQGVRPDAGVFSSLIYACSKHSDQSMVERWIGEMRRYRICPNQKVLSSIMNAYAKSGDVEQAEGWFRRMVAAEHIPDAVSYGCVIKACAKNGDLDRAERWFREMIDAGISPGLVLFNTMLHACAKSSDSVAACRWLHWMECQGLHPNNISFNSLVSAHMERGVTSSQVHNWLAKMLDNGVEPDHMALSTLARACHGTRKQATPQSLCEAHNEACVMMAEAYFGRGDREGGKRLLDLRQEAPSNSHGAAHGEPRQPSGSYSAWQPPREPSTYDSVNGCSSQHQLRLSFSHPCEREQAAAVPPPCGNGHDYPAQQPTAERWHDLPLVRPRTASATGSRQLRAERWEVLWRMTC